MSSYLWDIAEIHETLRDLAIRGATDELNESPIQNYLDIPLMLLDGRTKQAWGVPFEHNEKRGLIRIVSIILDHDHEELDRVITISPTCMDGIWYLLFSHLENRRWRTERARLIGELGEYLSFGALEEVRLVTNPFQEIMNALLDFKEQKRLKALAA
jgi:hypothetical protein